MHESTRSDRVVQGMSLIIAPLLFGVSTFLWRDGEYGAYGGTIVVVATVLWIAAFIGLFSLLKSKTPVYASIGLMFAIAGCVSGAGFGFADAYNEIFSISHQRYLKQLESYPTVAGLLLFWTGPLFPLTLLILGIVLIKTKTLPIWVGLMISISGVAFPLSRIPRIVWIAHCCDLIMFIPLCYIGCVYLSQGDMKRPAMVTK